MADQVTLDEALAHVLARCEPLAPRPCRRRRRAAWCWRRDVVAAEAVPPFANTAMDGYAVRAADTAAAPVTLPVVAEVAAGHPADRALAAGEAMRIFTGAPVPDGADAVVMVERTERLDGGAVRPHRASTVEPGNHVRAAGDDLQAGRASCSAPGDELTPARLGVLASLGVDEVVAHPRPRVGVLSTGDELVTGAAPLRPGQIRDSNRPTLLALVADGRVRARRPGPGPRRRGRHHRRHRGGRRHVRRRAVQRRGVDGRHRPGEGRARPDRRHALDAGGDPPGQAAGLRPRAAARRRPGAGVRPAGQPGLVAGQLRAVRPARPAPAGRARRRSAAPAAAGGGGRRAAARAGPTARSTSCGSSWRSTPAPAAAVVRVVGRARARTSWRRWPAPTAWWCCPTATGVDDRRPGRGRAAVATDAAVGVPMPRSGSVALDLPWPSSSSTRSAASTATCASR